MLVRGVILSHSLLAEAFISTVESIAGRQEDLRALSNINFSNEELANRLHLLLRDGQPTVIFTDFSGGSTYAVARQVVDSCSQTGKVTCAAITGINLPMLISFVTKRNALSFEALVEVLRQDGHRGIQ